MIYQTRHSFHDKRKPLPTKFCKSFLRNIVDNNVSIVIFDVYLDLESVNVASITLRIFFDHY